MNKAVLISLSILCISIFCFFETYAKNTSSQRDNQNIDQIMAQVEKQGAEAVLKQLYTDGARWHAVLNKVASADPEWIELAVILKPHSDAGASKMLNNSVGEALAKSPALVLRHTKGVFTLEHICGCPDIDDNRYSTYDQAVAELERRIEALKGMKSGDLDKERDLCLKIMEESVYQLKRFFIAE